MLLPEKMRELDASAMYKLDRLQDVGGVRCFAFDSKGEKLACGGINPNRGGFVQGPSLVIIFDWKSGKEISRIQSGSENDGYVYDLLFITDSILAGVSSGQPGSGKVFFNLMGETQPLSASPTCLIVIRLHFILQAKKSLSFQPTPTVQVMVKSLIKTRITPPITPL